MSKETEKAVFQAQAKYALASAQLARKKSKANQEAVDKALAVWNAEKEQLAVENAEKAS